MNVFISTTLSTALILGLNIAYSGVASASTHMAHAHMGHVSMGWAGTPEGKGFLPTAMAEAKTTAQHAKFAAKKPNDLGWMKTHIRHVLQTIDTSLESKGPGLGYGVLKATGEAAKHINFAAKSEGASNNIKAHAVHVVASFQNTMDRAQKISTLGQAVLGTKNASKAAPLVKEIEILSHQLLEGFDANGDGKITWHPGEGGLNAAEKHMKLMAKGEGMN